MSIARTGRVRTKVLHYLHVVGDEIKKVDLRAARRVVVTFDPFHRNAKTARSIAEYFTGTKFGYRNPDCTVKTEVVCDRRDPQIGITLLPEYAEKLGAKEVILNLANFDRLEALRTINKRITPLPPPRETTVEPKTKSKRR